MSQLEKKLKAQRRKQLKKQEEPSVIQKQFVEAVSGGTWRLASDVSSKDSNESAHQKATRLIAFYEKEGYEVTHLSTCIGGTGHDKLVITLIFTKSP